MAPSPGFSLSRRDMLTASALMGAAGLTPAFARSGGFYPESVDSAARTLAAKPFGGPAPALPPQLAKLSYDDYRDIRFDRRRALWADTDSKLIAEPMLRGFLARDRIELHEVSGGVETLYPFDPALFDFAKRGVAVPDDPSVGFSGVRFLAPLNKPDVRDEIGVFQGASYFRSLGRGQLYGISARGIAIGSGGPAEEFPTFTQMWLERPSDPSVLRLHALLDGPSLAGAYHFTIRPGETTTYDVDALLFPRVDMPSIGIAPMSSMFLFGPGSARRFDDFRRAVHDSDGLEIWSGSGERIWRPLNNPSKLSVSVFSDANPKGFGLMQRQTRLADFDDLEARYDMRPSLWVEPLDAWGPGSIQLLEIPAGDETGDNIAAFWRPRAPLKARRPMRLRYRLHWGRQSTAPDVIARAIATRSGATVIGARTDDRRHFAIDFQGAGPMNDLSALSAVATTSAGAISPVRLQAPEAGRVRASFDLTPPASGDAEMRLHLVAGDRVVSETWANRWAA